MSLKLKLEQGLQQAGLVLSAELVERLLAYLALLQKWNKVHNLTAVRDPDEMVTLHLLDSLVILPHIQAERLLDVGSGAGLPGIPLALCLPDLQVTVLDSSHKKTSFMRQVKAELQIDNLQVVCSRVEQFQPEQPFDVVISRAFSELQLFLTLTAHLCRPQGLWLAMKGVYPHDELAQISREPSAPTPSAIVPLIVPGLDAQRHLVFLPNLTATAQAAA
ncbi:16S rRNA (guanine(527)-N(7))-methyltransferase RsmG [Methylobacillus flagellatus]|uniref:16S rRNA (guanine(527)-N(7))-methyltransferase RsmG n=1 Tax=Methylobacillus flagellatus TaxID=405 RepID=UPI0010F52690|nr:16S rRNA (guanine(527)-N(7))-methyltransferase RsmG [Methylobacillus flagellatus]